MTGINISEQGSFLLSRRSVVAANLIDPGPTENELKKIIDIGIRVPDHAICSPWKIQIVDKEGQKKIGSFYADLYKEENPDAGINQIEYWKNRPQVAPSLLVITFYPNYEKSDKVPLTEQLLSCGALCQNILNATYSMGYFSQWLTEWPAYNKKVKEFFGHNQNTDIVGFIFIGSAKEKPKERRRPSFYDIATKWEG